MKLRRSILLLLLAAGLVFPAGMIAPSNPDDLHQVNSPTPQPPALPSAPSKAFLPVMRLSPVSTVDLTIGALEPTQAIQTSANSVPMTANRPTVLRIYTRVVNGAAAGNVRVSIHATRGGTNLSGSPLIAGPGTVPTAYSRGDINTSFNVRLPSAWLSGQVTLQVQLDSSNAVAESNEGNNFATLVLNFVSVPTLNVKVVPIQYNPPGGGSYPPASTAFLNPGLMKLYPVSTVSVTSRPAITVSCDFSAFSCWDLILDQITALKSSDGAPSSQVYYGIVPLENAQGQSWFHGGIAGLAWIGLRASLGLADSDRIGIDGDLIAAHEIGHNLGRDHAPCGVSGDRNYPYAGGMIGDYGLDTALMAVMSPSVYSDVMSYCDLQWISDYTYNAMRQNLLSAAADPVYAPGLLVRARLEGDQITDLSPAYAFEGYINAAPAGEATVEFLDPAGQLIASAPVAVLKASEPGGETQRINALVPAPTAGYSAYRIVSAGRTLAQRALAAIATPDAARPAAELRPSGVNLVFSWTAGGPPALVRFSLDDGITWTTLAIDWTENSISIPLESLPQGKILFQMIPGDRNQNALTLEWVH